MKYNYWDYKDAFNKVLLYENNKRKHSWFIKICSEVYNHEFPIWFAKWWQTYGTSVKNLPEDWKKKFEKWVNISPKVLEYQEKNLCIEGISSMLFFMEFSIPWIWKWTPVFGYTEEMIPCIKRVHYSKFWDKMIKENPDTKKIFGIDTLILIDEKIKIYEERINNQIQRLSPSPFDHITRKIKMMSEVITKEEMISLYMEEVKKDLMSKLGDENMSQVSDTSMDYAEAQNPNEILMDDIFDAVKDTLIDNIRKKKEASSSSSVELKEN